MRLELFFSDLRPEHQNPASETAIGKVTFDMLSDAAQAAVRAVGQGLLYTSDHDMYRPIYPPALEITHREVDGVTVLDCNGRITLVGGGSAILRETIRNVMAANPKPKVLLNFSGVEHVDASGIAELISAFTSVTNAGGSLRVVNLTHKLHNLAQITKIYSVLEVHNDEAQAIRSFA